MNLESQEEVPYKLLHEDPHARRHCPHRASVETIQKRQLWEEETELVNFTIGENVSKKSTPSVCVKPCATNLILCLLIEPSTRYLVL